jgi:hypothetical protein
MSFVNGTFNRLRHGQNMYPSVAFNAEAEAPVKLIEVTSRGSSRRLLVTEDLVETYIEQDYGVSYIDVTFM